MAAVLPPFWMAAAEQLKQAVAGRHPRIFGNGHPVHPPEPPERPVNRVLRLHQVPRAIRPVRRPPVPALRILHIDVPRLAKNRYRTLPFELRILLTVRILARKVAAGDVLCGTVFDPLDIAQRHLHGNPEHWRSNPGIVAGHALRDGKVDRAIHVPPFDRHAGLVSQHVLSAEPTIGSDYRLGKAQNRFPKKHLPEDPVQRDRVSQDKRLISLAVHLHVAAVVQAEIFLFRKHRIVEKRIRSISQRLHFTCFEHAGDMHETVPVEAVGDLLSGLFSERLAGLDRTRQWNSP